MVTRVLLYPTQWSLNTHITGLNKESKSAKNGSKKNDRSELYGLKSNRLISPYCDLWDSPFGLEDLQLLLALTEGERSKETRENIQELPRTLQNNKVQQWNSFSYKFTTFCRQMLTRNQSQDWVPDPAEIKLN